MITFLCQVKMMNLNSEVVMQIWILFKIGKNLIQIGFKFHSNSIQIPFKLDSNSIEILLLKSQKCIVKAKKNVEFKYNHHKFIAKDTVKSS